MSVTTPRSSDPATELAAKLQDPTVAASLSVLLDHADLIAVLVEGLSGLVERSETIGDSLLDGVNELRTTVEDNEQVRADKLDPGAIASSTLALAGVLPKAAPGMVAAVNSGAIDRILASQITDPAVIDQVARLADGLAIGSRKFATQPVRVSGPFALIGLLKDPDVDRALSYFATVAKAIGAELAKPSTASPTAR